MRKIIYSGTDKMRELIKDNNQLLPVLSRFDIAFGFGDGKVSEICSKNGVDTDTFLTVCNFLSGYSYDVERISLESLMKYLKHAHASFLDVTLPSIRRSLIEAINRADTNEVSLMLIKFFDDYVEEVRKHLLYENDEVFVYVEKLLSGEKSDDFQISKFSVNHSHMGAKLNELKDIFIYHYNQKDNDRLSAALFDIIMCERDLISHFEIESNLFVPAVECLERVLERKDAPNTASSNEEEPTAAPVLSQREGEIVRCVALGMSNKMIADALFISVNTVATHRRNISSKLGIHTTAGLTLYAVINGLVDTNEVQLL